MNQPLDKRERLDRQEIEQLREDIIDAGGWMEGGRARVSVLCDMALEALTLSSVARDVPGALDTPWPARDVVAKLEEAATILLDGKSYDSHGWETIHAAREVARQWLALPEDTPHAGNPPDALDREQFETFRLYWNSCERQGLKPEYGRILAIFADLARQLERELAEAQEGRDIANAVIESAAATQRASEALSAIGATQEPDAVVISQGMDHRALIDRLTDCPVGTKLYKHAPSSVARSEEAKPK